MPTALALIPHPDDESYSFAGTLRLLSNSGWRCILVCASAGDAGERHDGGPAGREALAAARRAELGASCALLGAELRDVWDLPDGRFTAPEGGPLVARALEEARPDVLLALGADGAYGHPDHLALHRWIQEARRAANTPLPALFAAFPRGLFLPQYEKCLEMMGTPPNPPASDIGRDQFDIEINIRTVAETKLAAIAAHRTQLPGGDPRALFPPGLVQQLLEVERFTVSGELPKALLGALPPWRR